MRVWLFFGGRSVEHEVSVRSARTVASGLQAAGYEVRPVGIAPSGAVVGESLSRDVLGAISNVSSTSSDIPNFSAIPESESGPLGPSWSWWCSSIEPGDVAFPIIHGSWGEDGALQGLFEMLDLPYVGPGVAASAVAMDKLRTKLLSRDAGVDVVPFRAATAIEFDRDPGSFLSSCLELPGPWFVKPSAGGSSVGVRRVDESPRTESSLAAAIEFALRFDDTVLVEQGIEGRELECALLGDPALGNLEASRVGEVVSTSSEGFYDYAEKYVTDTAELVAPAPLGAGVEERIGELAKSAFAAVAGAGMARVDFLMDASGKLFLNEINTLPGFTEISMYPRLWALSGVPLGELVHRLVELARRRHERRQRLDESIKGWIAGAG